MEENINLQKTKLEEEIREELEKERKLQEELIKIKENIGRLQEELNIVNTEIITMENLRAENEGSKENNQRNKRKNMEDFVEQQKEKQKKRKRRRQERFQEELISKDEVEEEEEINEDEQKGLIKSFKRACEEEMKKNRRIIKYWAEFRSKYEERMMEKTEESRGLIISEKEITEEINKEINEELSDEFAKNFKRKINGARKSKYIVDNIGIRNLGEISIDVIRDTPWKEIRERILLEEIKKNGNKVREINDDKLE